MSTVDALQFTNLTGNSAQKELLGGKYAMQIYAGTFNAATVQVQTLSRDGVTWINTGISLTAVGETVAGFLPMGQVRIAAGAATGVNGTLERIV